MLLKVAVLANKRNLILVVRPILTLHMEVIVGKLNSLFVALLTNQQTDNYVAMWYASLANQQGQQPPGQGPPGEQ